MWLFSKLFWGAALERAVKTSAQFALGAVGADQLNVLHADWATFGGFAAGGFVLSVLTSIVSQSQIVSIVPAEQPVRAPSVVAVSSVPVAAPRADYVVSTEPPTAA